MKLSFWISLLLILYVYAGYPFVLAVVAKGVRPTKRDDNFIPSVSLIIPAHNEEKILRDKLENSLAVDYPKDRIEIVVASDGSTDQTAAIAKSYASRGVLLHEIVPRGGKTHALNWAISRSRSEFLVLSDANTMYEPQAIRKLLRHFVDPTVGAVSGDVRLIDAADSHARSEGLYYRYERWLQSRETRVGSIIGADGGMYAVARPLFRAPPNDIILDDFVISMTVARLGFRVLYDPEAVAVEHGTLTSREEFFRKARIIAGGVQAIKLRVGLPRLRQPFLLFSYISHKLLRWLVPCFLLMCFISSAILATEPFYALVLGAQALFYGLALGHGLDIFGFRRLRIGGLFYYFSLVNSAALCGIWKGLMGQQTVIWQRTSR